MIYYNCDKTLKLEPFSANKHSVNLLTSWLNDPDVCEYNSHAVYPISYHDVLKYMSSNDKRITWAIMKSKEYLYVGNVSLQNINTQNRSAELAILIGNTSVHGQSVGTFACLMAVYHGFITLGLNRIYLGTPNTHIAMCKLAEKIGMVYEGTLQQAMFLHGTFVDVSLYGITRDKYDKGHQK